MKYAVTGQEMKQIDSCTIHSIGIPSLVLMEKAALAAAKQVMKKAVKKDRIIAVCGTGNNGGDGIAAARILYEKGFRSEILFTGGEEKASEQTKLQLEIAKKSGIPILNHTALGEYTIIIDAVFGIGLSRNIEGKTKELVEEINKCKARIYAIDIPSGINAENGKVLGSAVKASETITFGCLKRGMIFYPGCEYAGKVTVADIGFPKKAVGTVSPETFYYTKKDLKFLPVRKKEGNKGTFGRVLVIAGSENMSGACYLSAKAAYRTGAGLVKILTVEQNREALQSMLPEAIFSFYNPDKIKEEETVNKILASLTWADTVAAGPGLGMSEASGFLIDLVLNHAKVPVVLDADGINLIAKGTAFVRETKEFRKPVCMEHVILTPHVKEMSRLTGADVAVIKKDLIKIAKETIKNTGITLVLKDARTVTVSEEKACINTSGNNGMATGGSGDVLTGIIAALRAQGLSDFEAASMGAYVHGLAADEAAKQKGEYALMAGDIVEALAGILRRKRE